MEPVVVTGMGAVSPFGTGAAALWEGVAAGRNAIGPIERFDADGFLTRIAAEVRDFDPTDHMTRKQARRCDLFAQYLLAATEEARTQAGLVLDGSAAERTATVIGTGSGSTRLMSSEILVLHERGPHHMSAYGASAMSHDSAAGLVAMTVGAKGASSCITTACATGNTCVGEALRMIQRGDADVVVAGAGDATITPLDIGTFARAGALSRRNDDPDRACRPFDVDRDGFVMGEGAGVVVLESLSSAERRGAMPLAEIAGYGATTDAYHATEPDPEATQAIRAIRMALAEAGAEPGDVDYVNAHGTSTAYNDATETLALRAVLGDDAPRTPISSTKSMIGHAIGGAGVLELVVTIRALHEGLVPPTRNCDVPLDDELDFVPHRARAADIGLALSNSFGFGGHNAVLAVQRPRV